MSDNAMANQSTEEILASIQAAIAAAAPIADKPKPLACPVDPAERALCEGCQ